MTNKFLYALKVACIASLFLTTSSQAITYVFVSHSMPEPALQAYFKEAQHSKAILVMRGLYQDSFIATKNKSEALKITYDINPNLFEDYGIKVVPTIVEDNEDIVKKITGHIPLTEALKIFAEDRN